MVRSIGGPFLHVKGFSHGVNHFIWFSYGENGDPNYHKKLAADKTYMKGIIREYGAYKGRNPKTGKKIDVGAKKLPYFKVGKELKEMVDG